MKIVIAPDKFKGSLTAMQAAEAMAAGVRDVDPSIAIDLCPMADGGEGTVAAMVAATGGSFRSRRVTGPLAEMKVEATFGILGNGETAVIEMSAASGLSLLRPEDRNPLWTTTFGTGELLMAAAALHVRSILLGIGGSATVDGGVGCLQACGFPIILDDGEPVSPTEPLTASDLPRIVLIKHGRGSAIERVPVTVACDVQNPLCGPNGAARVFGPQKGASNEEAIRLDGWLSRLSQVTGKTAEAAAPGAGAAGGLGFAMLAYFRAALRSGVDVVLEASRFGERLRGADLCITGEGRLDASSLHGKTPFGVARACQQLSVPCVAVAGFVAPDDAESTASCGIADCISTVEKEGSTPDALKNAAPRVRTATAAIVRRWRSKV